MIDEEVGTNRHERMRKKDKTFMSMYQKCLAEHEVLTKCITSGIIATMGDFFAQCFEHNVRKRAMAATAIATVQMIEGASGAFMMHRIRLYGVFLEATFVASPVMHYAYNYMESLAPTQRDKDPEKSGDASSSISSITSNGPSSNRRFCSGLALHQPLNVSRWTAAIFHVFADVFILGPIFVFTMIFFTSIIEGKLSSLPAELMFDLIPAIRVAVMTSLTFAPIQLFAFKYLPLKFRILYMNFQDIVWNAIISVMAHRSRIRQQFIA